ncbi:zinc ribbon domain-containing protein [bacterium]|nr:zinc ribbon domain-containing protein [bacterium]
MEKLNYTCPKCGNGSCEVDVLRATGGGFAKVFDVQNKKFTTVTCTRCKYTEMYKADTSMLGNIFDFVTN